MACYTFPSKPQFYFLYLCLSTSCNFFSPEYSFPFLYCWTHSLMPNSNSYLLCEAISISSKGERILLSPFSHSYLSLLKSFLRITSFMECQNVDRWYGYQRFPFSKKLWTLWLKTYHFYRTSEFLPGLWNLKRDYGLIYFPNLCSHGILEARNPFLHKILAGLVFCRIFYEMWLILRSTYQSP